MKISSIAAALVMLLMVLTLNACGDGKSNSGGAQRNNVQCAANQILNNGQCQTCPANQTVVNNQCVLQCTANQIEQNGQCITPTPQCTGNQIVQNGSCVACLEAQVPNIERTMCIDNRSQCLNTQIEQNGLCVDCPTGQFASGNRCTTPPPPPLNCTANQIEQNGMCVDCGPNEMVSNNMCVPIPVTCGPLQIIVNNMCVDCGPLQEVQNNMCVDCAPGQIITNNMCADPNNMAPVVEAGNPQTIQLPTNMVTMTGSATDDGNPFPPNLAINWTSSDAANTTFADASSPTTAVTFNTFGTYTLTLTADDGQLTDSDTVQVTVNPAPNVGPSVTSVTANPTTVTLPTRTVTVTGAANDPDNGPNPLSTSWSSAGVSFTNPNALSTTATLPNTNAGNYTLLFVASDGLASDSGTVDVRVLLPGCPANSNINIPYDGQCTCRNGVSSSGGSADRWRVADGGGSCIQFPGPTHTGGVVADNVSCASCHASGVTLPHN